MTIRFVWGKRILAVAMLLLLLAGCSGGGGQAVGNGPQPFQLAPMELTAAYDKTYSEYNDPESLPEGARVDVKITVPQVKGDNVDELGAQMNAYFLGEGNALLWKAAEYLGTPGLQENETVTVEWDYKVMRNDDQWLSVRRQGVIYVAGAAYPTTALHSDTLRVVDGTLQVVTLEDLFDLPPEEIKILLVEKMTALSDGAYDREALSGYFDFNFFYLTEDALVFYYQEDQLGPHAIGTPEFSIPLADFSEVPKEGILLT